MTMKLLGKRHRFTIGSLAKSAGTVPGYPTSKISNHHSTITNPSLAPPACQRLPKKWPKTRGLSPAIPLKKSTIITRQSSIHPLRPPRVSGCLKVAKNAGTVPGYPTSKISNHHSTIINPPFAPPACQRLPKKWPKTRGLSPGTPLQADFTARADCRCPMER